MKQTLQAEVTGPLSLDNWCKVLQIVPLEVPEAKQIFQHILVSCKITKFYEVNFKILSRILAIPKVVAKVQNTKNISWCAWYGSLGSLEHILLNYPETIKIHRFAQNNFCLPNRMLSKNWIFGLTNTTLNPIIWLISFVIYKAHLCACNGNHVDIL